MSKKQGLLSKMFGLETIKIGANMTRSMINDAKPNKKEYIKETFNQALRRSGISKSEENNHLLKIYKNQKIQFFIINFGVAFLFFNGFKSLLFNAGEWTKILSGISFVTVSFALFSMSMHFAFRAFQIRNKKLGMLKYWMKTPSEWYPNKLTKERLEKVDNYQKTNKEHLLLSDSEYISKLKEGN